MIFSEETVKETQRGRMDAKKEVKRKTLMDRAKEATVRDPSEHAKRQVGELDKTAKASQLKRKSCLSQIESDEKEIAKIDVQIDRINVRYNPLCQQLEEGKQKREHLLKMLEQCNRDQKSIMNDSKNIVNSRRIDESKLSKSMASLQLQLVRGFSVEPDTTFKQTKH